MQKFNKKLSARLRRERAMNRLEIYLEGGIKTESFTDGSGFIDRPFTEAEKEKMNKELTTLRNRI